MELIHGNSLDKMKDIDDDSVNLILTDPPYNINHKNLEWDTIDNYIDFMIHVFKEGYRVLKKNGSLYFFHNDFKQIATLQIAIEKETNFKFHKIITITKDSYVPKIYKKSKSWISCCEYVLIYIKDDISEKKQIEYFQSLYKTIGKTKQQIKKDIPFADHCFRISNGNFTLPTKETYETILDTYQLINCKSYEELNYIYNGISHPNFIHVNFKKHKQTKHPCEKPQELLCKLINTASLPNDTILDMFMGCGSTGIACKSLNRQFIGIEKDIFYFNESIHSIASH
jgi:DNA modification methylase